jgi:hypothetical protein
VRHRPAVAADAEIAERVRERFVRGVLPLAGEGAEPLLRAFVQPPVLAVDIEVREIFVQTPGPGAGARLVEGEA